MSTTRRNFILAMAGSASGLILPRFHDRALTFLANHGEPLLEAPRNATTILNIYPGWDHLVSLGDPLAAPPVFTWRQMFEYLEPGGNLDDQVDYYGLEPEDLDCEANEDCYLDRWYSTDSGAARAARLLDHLGIGETVTGGQVVGGIEYICGSESMGGYNTRKALALDLQSVALLQHELNQRNAGIAIRLED